MGGQVRNKRPITFSGIWTALIIIVVVVALAKSCHTLANMPERYWDCSMLYNSPEKKAKAWEYEIACLESNSPYTCDRSVKEKFCERKLRKKERKQTPNAAPRIQ